MGIFQFQGQLWETDVQNTGNPKKAGEKKNHLKEWKNSNERKSEGKRKFLAVRQELGQISNQRATKVILVFLDVWKTPYFREKIPRFIMLLTLHHICFSSYIVLKMKNIGKQHFKEFQVLLVAC